MTSTLTNPFPGPRPFETGRRIFGRDREIEELYYLLSAERVVLLHSPSGAGKSSLINAGLAPRLAAHFDLWGTTRVNLPPPQDLPASVNRYVRSVVLGLEQQLPERVRRPVHAIERMTLAEYVETRPRRRSAPPNIVAVFDQFEEILTVEPLSVEAKEVFFGQLGTLLQNPAVWALVALREEYLAALDPYARMVPTHLKNRFRLDLLSEKAAKDAIAKPAEEMPYEGQRVFAPAAVDKLVRDLSMISVQQADGRFKKQPGHYVEPLQLQVVCRGLWDRMPEDDLLVDVEDVERFGDVTDALSAYYSTEVTKIAGTDVAVERALRDWVGEKLITPDGIRDQVQMGAGHSKGLDNGLIARLVDAHLVRAEQRANLVWYELAHDRLIDPVLKNNAAWREAHLNKVQQRVLQWLREGEPEGLLLLDSELLEAEAWKRSPGVTLQPEEENFLTACHAAQTRANDKRRNARLLMGALIASIVLFILAGVVARIAWKKSDEAEAALQTARNSARQVRWTAWKAEGDQLRVLSAERKRAEAAERETVRATAVRIVSEFDAEAALSQRESEALWDLTEANSAVVVAAVGEFLATAANAEKFLQHDEYLLAALLAGSPHERVAPVRDTVSAVCPGTEGLVQSACLALVAQLPSPPDSLASSLLDYCTKTKDAEERFLAACLNVAIQSPALKASAVLLSTVPDSRDNGLEEHFIRDERNVVHLLVRAMQLAAADPSPKKGVDIVNRLARVFVRFAKTAPHGDRVEASHAIAKWLDRKASSKLEPLDVTIQEVISLAGFLGELQADASGQDLNLGGHAILMACKQAQAGGKSDVPSHYLALHLFEVFLKLGKRVSTEDARQVSQMMANDFTRLLNEGLNYDQYGGLHESAFRLASALSHARYDFPKAERSALEAKLRERIRGSLQIDTRGSLFNRSKSAPNAANLIRAASSVGIPVDEELKAVPNWLAPFLSSPAVMDVVSILDLAVLAPGFDVPLRRDLMRRLSASASLNDLRNFDDLMKKAESLVDYMEPLNARVFDELSRLCSTPGQACQAPAAAIGWAISTLGNRTRGLDLWAGASKNIVDRLDKRSSEEVSTLLNLLGEFGTRIRPELLVRIDGIASKLLATRPAGEPTRIFALAAARLPFRYLSESRRVAVERIVAANENERGTLAGSFGALGEINGEQTALIEKTMARESAGARLGGLEWAAPILPDKVIARRLTALAADADTHRIAAICGLGDLISNKRPETNRFFVETVMRWPSCDREKRTAMIASLLEAGAFGSIPTPLPTTFTHLQLAELARNQGYDLTRAISRPVLSKGAE